MTRYAVTGAFGFSGRHIAAALLARGDAVLNLTNHPDRPDPFAARVPTAPLAFGNPEALESSLTGSDVLFNTYWVRFAHGGVTHEDAVRNSLALLAAARRAGVRRVVHVSIANPDPASPLPYYRGKAHVEAALAASGLSYAILRPSVLVGDEPILTNTIAWLLRHFPLFIVPGDGSYGIAPIHVADLVDLALDSAAHRQNLTWDAVGPETFTFTEYVRAVRSAIGSRALLVHAPSRLALLAAQALAIVVRDTVLTADEMAGLTNGLLVSRDLPRGSRPVSRWLVESGPWLGRSYMPEISRHFRGQQA